MAWAECIPRDAGDNPVPDDTFRCKPWNVTLFAEWNEPGYWQRDYDDLATKADAWDHRFVVCWPTG